MQYFKPRWLFFWWAMACFWFASWLTPATRELWDSLDALIFFSFNGSVAESAFWQSFWAIANWRPFDIVGASIILCLSFVWIYSLEQRQRLSALSGLAILLVIILATRFSAAFILYLTDYQRYSPSIVLSPTHPFI